MNEATAPAKRSWRAALAVRAGVLSVLLGLMTLAGFLGAHFWVFDLFAHFRLQYAVAGLGLLFVALVKPGWPMVAAASVLVVNLACIAPLYVGEASAPRGPVLVVTAFNVHTNNPEKNAVIEYLRGARADVIFVLEVDPAWLTALESLAPDYRVVIARPASDNFGIAALTRVTVTSSRAIAFSGADVQSLELVVPWDDHELVLLGTHAVPPMNAVLAGWRDEHLAELADWSRREPRPHAILGDLNATPWSVPFRGMVERGALRDAAGGRGWSPTWPYGRGALSLLRVPIDHALVSEGLEVSSLTFGPALGSDHCSLTVALARGQTGSPQRPAED